MSSLRLAIPFAVTVVVSLLHPRASGCDPSREPTVREKVEFSHVVAWGTVTKQYPNPRDPGTQFTAELDVWCVFKNTGGPVPVSLNITNGGDNPGKCFHSELLPGQPYVVFLHRLGSSYVSHVKEIRVTDAAAVSMVTSTCGLEVKDIYPQGFKKNKHKCPEIKFRPCPTTTPEVIVKRTKPTRKPKVPSPETPPPSPTLTYTEPPTTTTTPTARTTGVITDAQLNLTTSVPIVRITVDLETATKVTQGQTLAPPSERSGVSRPSWRCFSTVYLILAVVLLSYYSDT